MFQRERERGSVGDVVIHSSEHEGKTFQWWRTQSNSQRIRVISERQGGGGAGEGGRPWWERRALREEASSLLLGQDLLQLQCLAREPLHVAGNLFLRGEQRFQEV